MRKKEKQRYRMFRSKLDKRYARRTRQMDLLRWMWVSGQNAFIFSITEITRSIFTFNSAVIGCATIAIGTVDSTCKHKWLLGYSLPEYSHSPWEAALLRRTNQHPLWSLHYIHRRRKQFDWFPWIENSYDFSSHMYPYTTFIAGRNCIVSVFKVYKTRPLAI